MKSATIIRTVVLALALFNQCLTIMGKSVLPIEEESINQVVSVLFTICAAGATWWKNNSFSKEALEADEYMKELKGGGKKCTK